MGRLETNATPTVKATTGGEGQRFRPVTVRFNDVTNAKLTVGVGEATRLGCDILRAAATTGGHDLVTQQLGDLVDFLAKLKEGNDDK